MQAGSFTNKFLMQISAKLLCSQMQTGHKFQQSCQMLIRKLKILMVSSCNLIIIQLGDLHCEACCSKLRRNLEIFLFVRNGIWVRVVFSTATGSTSPIQATFSLQTH